MDDLRSAGFTFLGENPQDNWQAGIPRQL